MIILGITGPTGSGKSTLLQNITARNGCVLDLDAVYHELLETDSALLRELDDRFPGVIRNGTLERKALGAIVFADPEALRDLNGITGKYIMAEMDRRLAAAKGNGIRLAAIDAINLLEGDLPERCDATIAVIAPEEIRMRRIMERDGIPEDYARSRIAAQPPAAYYTERCDYTLKNDADREEFSRRCDALLDTILTGKD